MKKNVKKKLTVEQVMEEGEIVNQIIDDLGADDGDVCHIENVYQFKGNYYWVIGEGNQYGDFWDNLDTEAEPRLLDDKAIAFYGLK